MAMKTKYITILSSALLASAALISCTEAEFKIDGDVQGAEGKSIVLEKSDFSGYWVAVDSTHVGKNGHFKISSPAPASPEIYRLSLGNNFIYVPVDSVETLHVTSSLNKFGSDFSVTGSAQAERMTQFERELQGLQITDSAAVAQFKRQAYGKYIKDGEGSIVSYYVLTKFVGNKPLYDPTDPTDMKYYAAVATQFDQYRPNDPHGRMVREVSLQNMRRRNSEQGKHNVIQADELRVIDVTLPNEKGEKVSLSSIVGKGKPVAVIFSLMNEPESPVFNRELARIYNSKGGAVEFYQISFDAGQYEWREAARNLPWVTVIDPRGTASTALADYNVAAFPAIFIYNAAGDLVDRPATLDELAKKL